MTILSIDPTTITTLPEQYRPASTVRIAQSVGVDNRLVGYITVTPDGQATCHPRGDYSGPWILNTESIPT